MKPQFSCLTTCGSPRAYGAPWLAGSWWRPEDAARLLHVLVRPLLVVLMIAIVAAALLLGGRSLAPFVVGGIGGPGQLGSMSAERESAERDLRVESARLLESLEALEPAVPAGNGELP